MSIQLVPVLDLKAGLAVHAVRGERDRYAPVRSVLAPSADPVALASAFRAALGCQACYVADLDAITGAGDNGAVIRAIAALGLAVWLDAGVARAADAARALACGAQRVIVGTETLRDPGELPAIVTALEAAAAGTGPRPAARAPAAATGGPGPAAWGAPPAAATGGAGTAPAGERRAAAAPRRASAVLSLDLRDGRLLGGGPEVAGRDPGSLAELAWTAGVRAFIVLDLARVGSGEGVATDAARDLRRRLPGAEIAVGGGVRHPDDLRALARAGFDAALVATALHTGAITRADLASP